MQYKADGAGRANMPQDNSPGLGQHAPPQELQSGHQILVKLLSFRKTRC